MCEDDRGPCRKHSTWEWYDTTTDREKHGAEIHQGDTREWETGGEHSWEYTTRGRKSRCTDTGHGTIKVKQET